MTGPRSRSSAYGPFSPSARRCGSGHPPWRAARTSQPAAHLQRSGAGSMRKGRQPWEPPATGQSGRIRRGWQPRWESGTAGPASQAISCQVLPDRVGRRGHGSIPAAVNLAAVKASPRDVSGCLLVTPCARVNVTRLLAWPEMCIVTYPPHVLDNQPMMARPRRRCFSPAAIGPRGGAGADCWPMGAAVHGACILSIAGVRRPFIADRCPPPAENDDAMEKAGPTPC